MARMFESILPWDPKIDISGLLDGDAGRLLYDYSNIDRAEMDEHVKRAKKGWDVLSYPCFRKFTFLHIDLARSPIYPKVLEEIKSGHMSLDLGCGLGQDIRRLVQDGAPAKYIVGLDLQHAFIALGYELFGDEETLQSRFLCQDFWEDTPEVSSLAKNIKIINSGYFMHLWDWDTQLKAAKRMIELVSPTSGSVIAGIHFGSHSAGTWSDGPLEFQSMFLHNEKSLSKLWKQAGKETQTHWKFECLMDEDEDCKDLHPEGCRLRWVAVREES